MLPQLTPNLCADTVSAPPPPRYRPLNGEPRLVSWRPSSASGSVGLTEAQKAGLRYEAKVQDYLCAALGTSYYPAPYLHFLDGTVLENGGAYRTLVPDGLFFAPEKLVYIFEFKSQHMPEAWYQLRKLYEPVVKRLDVDPRTSVIEVVRSYDPAMGFPEPVILCSSLDEALDSPLHSFKVLRWRP